ncbi:hypothetical protein [Lysobacter sp. A3-1-A15]|uniref:hypothetical protein n=1 Tax=Novilysobacter viscosus TaxID=3098602 RepID=UPI003982F31E
MRLLFLTTTLLTLVAAAAPSMAQQNSVIQAENVRFDYAHVLRVTPVYQTLTATRMEEQCDQSPLADVEDESRLSRVVDAVRDALGREQPIPEHDPECRSVPVEREFRRPIAYDVDYVYKGAKFRSRLADDPGNRLRIRVSVSPAVAGARIR